MRRFGPLDNRVDSRMNRLLDLKLLLILSQGLREVRALRRTATNLLDTYCGHRTGKRNTRRTDSTAGILGS